MGDCRTDHRRDCVSLLWTAKGVKNALCLNEALIEEEESGKQFLTRDKNGVVAPLRLFL
jgi:hypothetical protein